MKYSSQMYRCAGLLWLLLLCSCAKPTESGSQSLAVKPSTTTPATEHELLRQIDEALDFTFARRLNTQTHAAWQIMHGCVAYRQEFLVQHQGQDIPALQYLFNNGAVEGWEFERGRVIDAATQRYGLRAIVRPGSSTAQGHADQWLGYLAGCDFPLHEPLHIDQKKYQLEDYPVQMEYDVPHNLDREFSWTLMALAKYRPHDYSWVASDGKTWSVPQLVEIELEHDLNNSACAGAHRMVGLALAYQRCLRDGVQPEGVWLKLRNRLEEIVGKVKEFQNSDGSLSSSSFARASQSADIGDALNAAGHVLEFLAVVLPEEELRAPWVRRAVLAQCKLLRKTKQIDVSCGGLYHSASGLRIVRERLFGIREFLKKPTN